MTGKCEDSNKPQQYNDLFLPNTQKKSFTRAFNLTMTHNQKEAVFEPGSTILFLCLRRIYIIFFILKFELTFRAI